MKHQKQNPLTVMLQTLVLFATQMLDYATTLVGLRIGARETNGIIYTVMENYGHGGFLTVKLALAAFLSVACYRLPAAAWALSGMLCGVSLWNLYVIYQLLPA